MKKYQVREKDTHRVIAVLDTEFEAKTFRSIYTALIQTEPLKGKGLQWVYYEKLP